MPKQYYKKKKITFMEKVIKGTLKFFESPFKRRKNG